MRSLSVILLSLGLTCGSGLALAGGPEIEIVTGQIPPYSYEDQGKPRGVAIELVEAMAALVGHSGKVTFLPWKRAVALTERVKDKPRLIIPLNRSPERETKFAWVTRLLEDKTVLVTRKGGRRAKVERYEEAKAYTVGVLLGSPLETELRNKGFQNIDVGVDEETNARKLSLGRVDVWFVATMVAPFVYKRLGLPDAELEYGASLQVNDLHLGATSTLPVAELLKWRDAMETIRKNGTYDRILKSYQGS